jgi:hypothetical protein
MLYVERIELPDYDRTLGGRVVRERGDRIYVIEDRKPPAKGSEGRSTSAVGPAAAGWRVALLVLGWAVWAAVVWREYGGR